MKVERCIEYMIGGRFFGEEQCEPIAERTIEAALAKLPKWAYSFRFYDLHTLSGKLENGEVIEKSTRENISGWHYPEGEVFDAKGIEALRGDYEILLSNMRCNKWPLLVRTRLNTWQPFNDGDVIVPADIEAKLTRRRPTMADAPMKPVEAWAVIGKDGKFLSAGNNKEILEGVWIGPNKPFRIARVVITEKEAPR